MVVPTAVKFANSGGTALANKDLELAPKNP